MFTTSVYVIDQVFSGMLVEGCMYVVLLIQCVCIWIVAWVCVWANAGLFYQRVMNCTSCQYGLFTCLSATPPIDCGGEINTHIFTQQNNFSNSSLYKHIFNHTRISFPCVLFGSLLSEHHVEADEGVGVVLDCFLPWHTLVVGQTEYYYSWLPAKNVHVHTDTNPFQ